MDEEFIIYISASSELKRDRDAFEIWIRTKWEPKFLTDGIKLIVNNRDTILQALSKDGVESIAEGTISKSKVFVSLVGTRAIEQIETELNTAAKAFFQSQNTQPSVWAYFRNQRVLISEVYEGKDEILGLFNFLDRLKTSFKLNAGCYESLEDLQGKFDIQLESYLRRQRENTTVVGASGASAPPRSSGKATKRPLANQFDEVEQLTNLLKETLQEPSKKDAVNVLLNIMAQAMFPNKTA